MIDRRRIKAALRTVNFWSVLANLLGVAGLLTAVLFSQSLAPTILLLLLAILIVYRQRRAIFSLRVGVGPIARYFAARYLFLSASVAHLFATHELTSLWVVVAVMATLSIELERLLRTLNGIAVPYAANLPDRRTRMKATFRYGHLFILNLVSLVLMAVVPPAPSELGIVALAVASIALLLGIAGLVDVIDRIRRRRAFQRDICQVLEGIEPIFYLYWHAEPRSVFQVAMWLPYLERIGVPFAIVVRTVRNMREVARITDRPVVLRRAIKDLDDVIVPSARAVFYVNNAARNNHMIRYSQLTHIQLLHGESDKASSVNPVMRMFDLDFVAGQAAIDRFALWGIDMPQEMFRIVGRPQVEGVELARGPIPDLESPSVLYAPTWKGYQQETNYSSLPHGERIVSSLLERGCTVVFRPHPYSYRDPELRQVCHAVGAMLEADARRTGRQHLYGPTAETEMSVFDCFNASDAMISDVSSVVGDFLFSHKPFAMVSTGTNVEDFVRQFPMARAAYVLEGDLGNLASTLDDMLGKDTVAAERIKLAAYYLGDIPRDSYADHFVEVARREMSLPGTVTEQ